MSNPPVRFFKLPLIGALLIQSAISTSQAATLPVSPVTSQKATSAVTALGVIIDPNSGTVSISIPANVNSVLLQKRPISGGKWENYKAFLVKAAPASLRVSLPKDYAKSSWSATGTKVTTPPTKKKYPDKFFAGKKTFGQTVAPSYTKDAPVQAIRGAALSTLVSVASSSVTASSDAKTAPSSVGAVEESDIWKADGSVVYFFNQLRGLQVIDLSDPSDPTLIASYRLPAKGQDMYIVKGPGTVRYALLITQEYNRGSWVEQTGVQVIKVNGSSAKVVSSIKIPGWLADSRLVGNRIYLATQKWSWNSADNTDAVTLNDIVLDTSTGSVTLAKTQGVKGNWPVISAGNDWLTVTQSDWSDWQNSWTTLFSLGPNGATKLTDSPVKLFGRLSNKYYVQYENGILSTVSQRGWWNDQQVILENFDRGGYKLGSLEIMKNENLMSARFAGDKAYVVTFRQTDPLFVVDLSNASNPVIAGHLEVPGFSTHIEPIGDKLFTIGFDAGKVAASIFDVSDPANPVISTKGRIILDGTWGYSAATYDDKALKVLPQDGLALIPYTSFDNSTGSKSSYIQILKVDVAGGQLSKGGVITHRFDPLRATLVNGVLASISQKELVTASLPTNGDPSLLADLLLAWPVNRIITTTKHLIQIEDGASPYWWGWYGSGVATARVSPLNDPDSGLSEIPLGKGVVKDAVLKGSSLYVLRQNPDNASFWRWGWYDSLTTQENASPTLFLDIYDASRLPDLKLSGSTSIQLPGNDSAWDLSGLLFPSAKSAVVVAQPQARSYRWGGYVTPLIADASVGNVSSAKLASPAVVSCEPYIFNGYQPTQSKNAAVAVVFQTENLSAPVAQPVLPLTDTNSTPVVSSAAGGGMLIYGYASKETPLADGTERSTSQHNLRILDLSDPTSPILGQPLALPGRLVEVSDITADGFLAWTQTRVNGSSGAGQFQVSACNVASLSQIASLSLTNYGGMTTAGRNLFTIQGKAVARYILNYSGVLAGAVKVTFDWIPSSLKIGADTPNTLIGSDSQNLFSWSYTNPKAQALDWTTDRTVDIQKAAVRTDGSVLAPAGEYGVDDYQP